jgi:hypothetical protein
MCSADYLPREVFFDRFGFAGVFFTVWLSAFGRFFPATARSHLVDGSQLSNCTPPAVRLALGRVPD